MAGEDKIYLGDGAYVRHEGGAIVITAENGMFTTDEIHLEPEVLVRLIQYSKGEIR